MSLDMSVRHVTGDMSLEMSVRHVTGDMSLDMSDMSLGTCP